MNLTERTPDGHPQVWDLYRPEPFLTDGVWLRRCDTFTSEANAKGFLNDLLGVPEGHSLPWRQHPMFPELQQATDGRGHWWYLVAKPLDPPGRRAT